MLSQEECFSLLFFVSSVTFFVFFSFYMCVCVHYALQSWGNKEIALWPLSNLCTSLTGLLATHTHSSSLLFNWCFFFVSLSLSLSYPLAGLVIQYPPVFLSLCRFYFFSLCLLFPVRPPSLSFRSDFSPDQSTTGKEREEKALTTTPCTVSAARSGATHARRALNNNNNTNIERIKNIKKREHPRRWPSPCWSSRLRSLPSNSSLPPHKSHLRSAAVQAVINTETEQSKRLVSRTSFLTLTIKSDARQSPSLSLSLRERRGVLGWLLIARELDDAITRNPFFCVWRQDSI